ncbi:MAG: hypothetical protein JJU05_06860 [Verrucomicrobia bacterium]|nr:hypothetical protein [Verrucomicrobiota bacterium]
MRFTLEVARPDQAPQVLRGPEVPLADWEEAVDALAAALLQSAGAEPLPVDEAALRAEAERLGALAMRFYAFDPDRALRFADTAWMMGNRGRDVLLIRTQSRLQDLFMKPRTPLIHALSGVPPTLMRETFHMEFHRKYGRTMPVEVLESMLTEVTGLQREVLHGADQWSREPRGWIALKTVMYHAREIQIQASLHPEWARLRPAARRNARELRRGIAWLHENGEYSDLLLVSGLENNPELIWEDPGMYYEAVSRGLAGRDVNAGLVERLRHLEPGRRSRLSDAPDEVWEAARREQVLALAGKEDLVSRLLAARLRVAVRDPAFGGADAEKLEAHLLALVKETIQLEPREVPSGLSFLRELGGELEEERPGLSNRFAAAAFDGALALSESLLPPEASPSFRNKDHERAAMTLTRVYELYFSELFEGMDRGERISILRRIGTSRVDEVNSRLYPMVQNAREWLSIYGEPLPARNPVPAEVRMLIPAGENADAAYEPPPGHMVDFHGRGAMRGAVWYGNGLRWAWNLRTLTLHGFDPRGVSEPMEVSLPPAETPGDALYRHCLYPIRVEGDWVLFHARIPMPGRGRFAALRISDGQMYEHFIDEGEPRAFSPLLRGFTALPFGGHIRGDVYVYSPVTVDGGSIHSSTPKSAVYALNLITGEHTTLTDKDLRGPLPGSRNPPGSTGHLIPWGAENSAILRLNHNRRGRTVTLILDIHDRAAGEWRREEIPMPELLETYSGRSVRNVERSPMDPRLVILRGRAVVDTEAGGLADPSVAFAGRAVLDPDTLEWGVDREVDGMLIRYVFEGAPASPDVMVTGDRMTALKDGAVQVFDLTAARFPETEPMADLRNRALDGDTGAAMELSRHFVESLEFDPALFWTRRAARAGRPGAASLLAMFYMTEGFSIFNSPANGSLSVPWIQRALDEEDPWAYYALHAMRVGIVRPPPHPDWRAPEGKSLLQAAGEGGVVPALHHVALEAARENPAMAYAAMRATERLERERVSRGAPEPSHVKLHRVSAYGHRFPPKPVGGFASAEAVLNRLPPDAAREARLHAGDFSFPHSLPSTP